MQAQNSAAFSCRNACCTGCLPCLARGTIMRQRTNSSNNMTFQGTLHEHIWHKDGHCNLLQVPKHDFNSCELAPVSMGILMC